MFGEQAQHESTTQPVTPVSVQAQTGASGHLRSLLARRLVCLCACTYAVCMLHASDNTHMRHRRTYTCQVHVYAACSGHVQSPTRSSGAADRSAVCMRMLHVHAAFPHSPRPPHQRSETRAAGLPIWREGCSRSNLQTHRARVYHPMAPTSPQVRPEATYPATGAPQGYEAQASSNCVSMRTFVWKLACRAWTPPSLRCTRG